ncbi:MAG TPA: hypothetical protein VEC99_00325 [Clostridia bacterium]|nr:hypothetical protein [Clostridia bacterium]
MDRREILLSLAADDRTRDKANNWLLEDPDPYFVREFEQKANWRSLIRLAIYSPRSFIRHGRKFRILDRIELGQDQCSDVNESELTEILKRDSSHLDDAAFDVIYYLTGMTKLKFMHNVIPNILERVRYCSSNNDAAEYLWTDDASISGYFARKTSDSSIEREYPVILKLWANHVASKHAFAFCWQILNPTFDSNECGKTYDERLARLRDLLLTKPQKVKFSPTGERQWKKSLQWRRWYAALFNAICGLIARDQWNHSYGEAWVRQTEAISLVAEEPSHLPDVVYGILDRGREHWNVLDPIILGMPRKPTIECLSEYIGSRGDSRDNYFHAKLLLGHLQGAVPVESAAAKPTGLLGAVETLIEASRTKLPDSRTRTWIGDPGVESLWHGAIQKSVNDFIEYYRGQFGQDEHEHVAVLADNLVKCLNATNSTIRQWFQHRQACPLFIKASVRRFPKRAPAGLPQEGGRNGIQADIAFIVDCNVPGLVRSKRITLIQAKDLELAKPPSGWAGEFPFHGEDRVQINNLLCHSKEAHYLFFTHPDIGCHPMIFPALSVLDSCKAGKLAVPLSVVRSGGMPIPDFMLHGVIGLWAGDESEELIAVCEQGHERGLGPRILIDIKIARGDNDSR